jgi:hypothetical protein
VTTSVSMALPTMTSTARLSTDQCTPQGVQYRQQECHDPACKGTQEVSPTNHKR